MNVLMVGVDKNRSGGMWTVSETYITSEEYNNKVNLYYVATSTCGSALKRLLCMLKGYFQILWVLLVHDIDLVHIHMAERGSTYRKGFVVLLGKAFKKKVVVQMHAGPFIDWLSGEPAKKQEFVKKILRKADRILVLGKYWKDQIKVLVPEDKIDILYNGSDCPETNSYHSFGNLMLYLGLLKKTKGIYDLIEAIRSINDRLPNNFQLCLCGTDEEGDIAQRIEQYHLDGRIKMLGWISKEKRLELFQNTQLCVLPSYFEALSMTVIESMCYGIPIITTRISTMAELLGDDTELVEPGDYKALGDLILKWSSDEALRIQLSNKLYERAKARFSVSKNIENTLSIYSDVLRTE